MGIIISRLMDFYEAFINESNVNVKLMEICSYHPLIFENETLDLVRDGGIGARCNKRDISYLYIHKFKCDLDR
jgi:hypothetical protein